MQECCERSCDMGKNGAEYAEEAAVLRVLRMLDKAIAEGKDFEQFRKELDAYADGIISK